MFTARYGPRLYRSRHCVPPSLRAAIRYASYLREHSIRFGGALKMGGPSARTSNCSHGKKQSAFHKMLRLEIGFAVCGLKS